METTLTENRCSRRFQQPIFPCESAHTLAGPLKSNPSCSPGAPAARVTLGDCGKVLRLATACQMRTHVVIDQLGLLSLLSVRCHMIRSSSQHDETVPTVRECAYAPFVAARSLFTP
jgi:hypothetical protein